MNARFSKLSYGFLAAGFVLSLAAVGCGDDDSGSGGSGGSGGSAGSSTAGKSGSSGSAAGKSGSGGAGGTVSTAMCEATAATATGGKVPTACIACGCTSNAQVINDCSTGKDCWALIDCVNTKCTAKNNLGMTATNCAIGQCSTLLTSSTQATAAGKILQSATCNAKCPVPTDEDAGVDAGN